MTLCQKKKKEYDIHENNHGQLFTLVWESILRDMIKNQLFMPFFFFVLTPDS
jgi:hypothetical protein